MKHFLFFIALLCNVFVMQAQGPWKFKLLCPEEDIRLPDPEKTNWTVDEEFDLPKPEEFKLPEDEEFDLTEPEEFDLPEKEDSGMPQE